MYDGADANLCWRLRSNVLLTVVPCWRLVWLASPLTHSGEVRRRLWIKALRSNELITEGSAFSTELKALCYYVSYSDKRHIMGASREVRLTQFLSIIIRWESLALQIGTGGLWSRLWPSSRSIGLAARERQLNANYPIINNYLLAWILTLLSCSGRVQDEHGRITIKTRSRTRCSCYRTGHGQRAGWLKMRS